MIRYSPKYILLFAFVLAVFAGLCNAQPRTPADTVSSLTGIEIGTSIDKAEIYVGDLVTYTVTITYDSTIGLVPPPLGANLGAFDVKDYQPDIETKLPDGRKRSESIFVLSTFTTGDYVIPPVPIIFNLPDSSRKVMLTEPVPIKVLSMLLNAGDSADIKPLKRPYEFKRDWKPYLLWGGAGLVLLALATFLWFRFRKKRSAEEEVDRRPAWEVAYSRLAVLKEQHLPTAGKFKDYYFELTEILRWYLGRIYSIDVLEMTTEEFLDRFEMMELPDGLYYSLEPFMKHADLVKFAKLLPDAERAEADFTFVHSVVGKVQASYLLRTSPQAQLNVPGQPQQPVATGGGAS